jgi:outer membrane protein
MSRRLCSRLLATLLFTLLSFSLQAAQTVNIAVLYDGPIKREVLSFEQIKKEIIDLNGREFNIQFPEQYRRHGNWKMAEIRQNLIALLNDPNVDIIIANGLLSSQQAALIENLNKPVIAPEVADRILQNLPYQNGVSGKKNYVYISENKLVGDDLRRFSSLVGFKHLLIPADHLFLEAIPELRLTTEAMQTKLGFKITMLPIKNDLMEVLDTMPPSIDAIYFPPLQRFNTNDFKQLNQGFIKRRIPTYSLIGREEVKMGVLAASGGRESDNQRYTRRIALYVQSILLGADSSFGFFTILGILSLAGIIINNAIVLIDRIKIEIEELGKAANVAVIAACQQRLRPILLTTATTVLGMMPLWWGGTAMFRPMAISIIFGLAFATVITLFLVPVLYGLFFKVDFSKTK